MIFLHFCNWTFLIFRVTHIHFELRHMQNKLNNDPNILFSSVIVLKEICIFTYDDGQDTKLDKKSHCLTSIHIKNQLCSSRWFSYANFLSQYESQRETLSYAIWERNFQSWSFVIVELIITDLQTSPKSWESKLKLKL